jgi:hypothetical protein
MNTSPFRVHPTKRFKEEQPPFELDEEKVNYERASSDLWAYGGGRDELVDSCFVRCSREAFPSSPEPPWISTGI